MLLLLITEDLGMDRQLFQYWWYLTAVTEDIFTKWTFDRLAKLLLI